VHRSSILIIVQRHATQSSLFIIVHVHSTYCGCQPHLSSRVHKTVTTASGTGHIFCATTSLKRGQFLHGYILFYKFTLHVRVSTTPIIENTQNSNYRLRYWSNFLCNYLPRTWPIPTWLSIILQVHSTCFACQLHPSSRVHKTLTTDSGTGQIFCATTSLERGQFLHGYILFYKFTLHVSRVNHTHHREYTKL